MRAQVLNAYGDADQFELTDVAMPDAREGQVRIRVRAIGLNPMDVRLRSGSLKDEMPIRFPAILGSDMAGVIDQLGGGVTALSKGDRVAGLAQSGAYAEYAIASAELVSPIPDEVDFEHAATIPTAGEAAQRAIKLLHPKLTETVVVNGAAGSVGSAAVQLLVRMGVKVIGTASEDNQAYLRKLGAEPTTYGDGVLDRIRELAPQGVDAVFDVADHGFADAAIALRGGTKRIVTISDFAAAQRGITVSYGDRSKITRADFAPIIEMAAAGEFVTEIAKTFAFDQLPTAHRFSERGHLRGKIVVTGPSTR